MGQRRVLILLFVYLFFAMPCFAIKIGLQTRVNKTYIGASTKAQILDARTNKLLYEMTKMKGYELKPYKGVIAIKIDGQYRKIKTDQIIIKPEAKGFVSVKRKWYRGYLTIQNRNNKFISYLNNNNSTDYIISQKTKTDKVNNEYQSQNKLNIVKEDKNKRKENEDEIIDIKMKNSHFNYLDYLYHIIKCGKTKKNIKIYNKFRE